MPIIETITTAATIFGGLKSTVGMFLGAGGSGMSRCRGSRHATRAGLVRAGDFTWVAMWPTYLQQAGGDVEKAKLLTAKYMVDATIGAGIVPCEEHVAAGEWLAARVAQIQAAPAPSPGAGTTAGQSAPLPVPQAPAPVIPTDTLKVPATQEKKQQEEAAKKAGLFDRFIEWAKTPVGVGVIAVSAVVVGGGAVYLGTRGKRE